MGDDWVYQQLGHDNPASLNLATTIRAPVIPTTQHLITCHSTNRHSHITSHPLIHSLPTRPIPLTLQRALATLTNDTLSRTNASQTQATSHRKLRSQHSLFSSTLPHWHLYIPPRPARRALPPRDNFPRTSGSHNPAIWNQLHCTRNP